MKLKALDSFYTDETKMVSDGQVFEVESEELGKDLIKRGVVREAKASDKEGKERGAAPSNKDAGSPAKNKDEK